MTTLAELKEQAESLGVKYHHMSGEAKIQELIDAHIAEHRGLELKQANINPAHIDKETGKIVPKTSIQYRIDHLPDRKKLLNRLVRIRMTCMNPAKREWEGEIFSVGSAKNGTFKKYVPFDGREWHVPQIIYDAIKERKCTIFHTVKDTRGQKIRKGRLIDEFAVEVLPPLTPKELSDLRKTQALADGQTQ